GRLEEDSQGSLYGTAYYLGGGGAIYRLKQRNGIWRFKDVFNFDGNGGEFPNVGLTVDRANAVFYGVTLAGGVYGDGTVFSFAPAGRGGTETVLHSFSGSDGYAPDALLYKEKTTGNLFG